MNGWRVARPMLITRTPLRVSFCGGGTDLDAYFREHAQGGAVTSLALARHIYVTVNRRFDDSVRISYSNMEIVDDFEELKHELVREAMRITGVTSGVEITTIADIPSRGTGLGSSSSVTVGLLHALHTFAGRTPDATQLAEEACRIEIDVLGGTIGKQDQYAAAFGGANRITFHPDDSVTVNPLSFSDDVQDAIRESFCLVYTGQTRQAGDILVEQVANTEARMDQLTRMRDMADEVATALEAGNFATVGILLEEGWQLKQGMASGITSTSIDELHARVRELGVTGGKLLGAGGGGFILCHTPAGVQQRLASQLDNRLLPLELSTTGSIVLFDDRGE